MRFDCFFGKNGVLIVIKSKKIVIVRKFFLLLSRVFVSIILRFCKIIGIGMKFNGIFGIKFKIMSSVIMSVI